MIVINRHNVALPSVCVCQADDIKGIYDEQLCRFPVTALTSEILPTVEKFAKRPVELTVVIMSL